MMIVKTVADKINDKMQETVMEFAKAAPADCPPSLRAAFIKAYAAGIFDGAQLVGKLLKAEAQAIRNAGTKPAEDINPQSS